MQADFTPTYGAFKCQKAGIYFFTFSAISPEGSDLRISLRSNGVPVVTIYSGGTSTYNSATGSGLLQLAQGDIVYLYIEKGDIYESNKMNRAYTTFSGFQISESRPKGFLAGLMGRNSGFTPVKDAEDKILTLMSTVSSPPIVSTDEKLIIQS